MIVRSMMKIKNIGFNFVDGEILYWESHVFFLVIQYTRKTSNPNQFIVFVVKINLLLRLFDRYGNFFFSTL